VLATTETPKLTFRHVSEIKSQVIVEIFKLIAGNS